jgi:hypothetical protein
MPERTMRIAPNFDLRPVVGQRFLLETPNSRSSISVDDPEAITFKQVFSKKRTPNDESNDIMDWMQFSMEHLRFLSAGPEATSSVL